MAEGGKLTDCMEARKRSQSSGLRRSRNDGMSTGYLTTADAATYANCCEETIRRAIRCRQLQAVRVGRTWRTRIEWVDAWLLAEVFGQVPVQAGEPVH